MPKQAVEMAESINLSSKRLLSMVDDFLAMNSLESRGIEFTMSMESPAELARVAGGEIEPVSVCTGTSFDLKLSDAVPYTAMNLQHVYRAVLNLLYNAFAYTPKGGNVGLSVGVETRKGDEYVAFTVTDDGPGIPGHEVPKLFERYYRSPGAKNIPGTGMGLSIVKAVAEAHGGIAEVDSEPGKGSTFRLLIPVRKI
jgi:signal transduction histidine kinase